MKLPRSELKAIVKECLLEILSEGLGAQALQAKHTVVNQTLESKQHLQQRSQSKKVHPLDQPVSNGRVPTSALKEAIKREAGGNPIMEAIFADTARTTLPKMLGGGDTQIGSTNPTLGVSPHAIGQKEQFSGTPEEIFGEGSARWANLAFMDATPGKNTA